MSWALRNKHVLKPIPKRSNTEPARHFVIGIVLRFPLERGAALR